MWEFILGVLVGACISASALLVWAIQMIDKGDDL